MLDKEKNEIDKLFQSKLDKEISDEDWNTPSMSILENALAELEPDEPKKERRYPFFFLLSFIGVLSLSAIAYQYISSQQRLDIIDQKIEEIQKEKNPENNKTTIAKNSVDEVNDVQNNKVETTTAILDKTFDKTNDSPSLSIDQKNKRSNVVQNTTSNIRFNSSQPENKFIASTTTNNAKENVVIKAAQNNFNQTIAATSQNTAVRNSKNQGTIDNSKLDVFESIPTLSLQALALRDLNEIADFTVPTKDSDLKFKRTISAFVRGGLHWSSFSMKRNIYAIGDVSPEIKMGNNFAIGANYQLSKRWSTELSLHSKSVSVANRHDSNVTYLESDEMVNSNGQLVNRMALIVDSPMETYYTSVDVPIEQNEMAEGDIMQCNTMTTNHFNVLGINGGANFLLAKFNKLDLIVKAGLSANLTTIPDVEMNTQIMFDDKLMIEKNSAESAHEQLFSSGQVGFQVDYRLNDKMSIGLINSYERSFTSFYLNPIYNHKSRLHNVHSTLNLSYKF